MRARADRNQAVTAARGQRMNDLVRGRVAPTSSPLPSALSLFTQSLATQVPGLRPPMGVPLSPRGQAGEEVFPERDAPANGSRSAS